MFSSNKKTTSSSSSAPAIDNSHQVETMIGKSTTFQGTITSDTSIRIEGAFEGSIASKGDVFIGPNGKVTADLFAKNVTISGQVIGNVSVDEKLELLAGSSLNGDIKVRKLVIEEGAIFKGISETRNDSSKSVIPDSMPKTPIPPIPPVPPQEDN